MDADLFLDDARPARRAWVHALASAWQRLNVARWAGSLYLRLVLGGLLALAACVGATVWLLARHAEGGLLETARVQGLDDAQRLAAEIGTGLDQVFALAETTAGSLPDAAFAQPERVAEALSRALLPATALANVFAGRQGDTQWAYADSAGVRRLDVQATDRTVAEWVMRQGRPAVSAPMLGRISGEPVVVLALPVMRDGQLVGIVGGSLRLASRDLLDDLAAPAGAGVALRVTDRQGRLLAHPERSRLMGQLGDDERFRGAWQAWQARAGGAPLAAWVDDGTVHAVAAVPGHDWLLWSAQPREALLAPVDQARQAVLPEVALVVLSVTLALAMLLRWQLRPLRRLERHARALLAGEDRGDWPQADGELGRLARTLHHLWAERTQMESFNAQVLQKLGSVMSAAPVGLAFTRNQQFELVSAELCRLLGRQEGEVVGHRTQMIFASNEDHAALGPQVAAAFAKGQPYSGEWPLLRADGSRFWGLLRARPVAAEQPEAGTIWSVNDVSEQVAARRQLEHAAHHDALTGVVNRQGFELALQSLFDAQPGSRPASLVMIDLDHFKPINDTAGHAAGDAMLVAVAQAIASRVRATDVVVRLGGDEFALLLPHCPHERALGVAEKVREAITDLALTWEAHTLRVGASLGVAELGEHHESPAQWMAQADAACYEAKRHGRGRVRAARPELKVMHGGR